MLRSKSLLFLFVAAAVCPVQAETAAGSELPSQMRNFRLEDQHGESHELYRYRESKAVVLFFAGNGCPIVRKSIANLKALRDEYRAKGVTFLSINSNPGDDRESVLKECEEYQIDFPILLDEAQVVARTLKVDRTATVLVAVPKDWRIAYRGAVDDRLDYGAQKPEASHAWLKDALEAVLAGQEVATPVTEAKGCLIDLLPEPKKLSYSKHIGPMLKEKCAGCHAEGNIGPFPMDSYEEVASRTRMVREVVMTKRMPPWHAREGTGPFRNDASLDTDELRSLVAWLDDGAPRGKGKDPLEKVLPMESAWPLGEPDIVVSMPEPVHVPADGVVEYQYIRVPYTGTEDVWLRAADVLPGDRSVMHHALIFLRYPEHLRNRQPEYEGGLDGFFAGYVPGMLPSEFPKGTAKFVPAGSEFVFQLHYSPTGKPTDDLTRLGLYLYKGQPKRALYTRAATDTDFAIPPHDPGFAANAAFTINKDTVLYSMSPHMHFRGKKFRYTAAYPDGTSEVLLDVPHYDFNWQTMYEFDKPKLLPAGTRILCDGAFDNSASNPMNPDSERWVYFGEQTFEEMFIGYLRYTYAEEGDPFDDPNGPGESREVLAGLGEPITAESLPGSVWRAGRFKLRFRPDGVLQVGRVMTGTWAIEGEQLRLDVDGETHLLRVEGDHLLSEDGPLALLDRKPAG
ncbi:MAG: redoxin domain-containing protein [Candidatus Hydrogenedentes bacterium]|nr:redoxin domain-containing protein [Candidatus Hydrogenedentota bacterium]